MSLQPLHTGGSPRFYARVATVFVGATVVLTLMAMVKAGKESCEDANDQGVREVGSPVGTGGPGDSALGDGGADSEVPERLPVEDFARHCDVEPPEGFSLLVEDAAEATNINPRLIALTVYRESRCKADAVGAAGEIGLGQVYPAIWTRVLTEEGIIGSVDDLYDPATNLKATGFILGEALRYAKGDPADALRRYNGTGPAAERYARDQANLYRAMWGEHVWFRDG